LLDVRFATSDQAFRIFNLYCFLFRMAEYIILMPLYLFEYSI
jgi:hypothetical protein